MTGTASAYALLLSQFQLGKLWLRNQLVGLPHWKVRIQKGVPDAFEITYWERRKERSHADALDD